MWDRGLLNISFMDGKVHYGIKAGPVEILVGPGCPFCNHSPDYQADTSKELVDLDSEQTEKIKSIVRLLDLSMELAIKGSFGVIVKPDSEDEVEKNILAEIAELLPKLSTDFPITVYGITGEVNGAKEDN